MALFVSNHVDICPGVYESELDVAHQAALKKSAASFFDFVYGPWPLKNIGAAEYARRCVCRCVFLESFPLAGCF